jgi:hypothetical protein
LVVINAEGGNFDNYLEAIEKVNNRKDVGRQPMAENRPRYSKQEFARRGEAIFEKDIRPKIPPGNDRKFVLIDIETGDYEIDADEMAASKRLLARRPNGQVWMRRVGSPFAHHFGSRLRIKL